MGCILLGNLFGTFRYVAFRMPDPVGLGSSYYMVSFPGWCDMEMRLPMPLYSFLFQARAHKNRRFE